MELENTEQIEVLPLGAGQDVGRSCVIVRIRDKSIMFDVGVHMVYTDMKRLPDFDFLKKGRDINECVDLVLVTHFHLDHCGALPYLTEYHCYSGPILASTPTRAMLFYMLDDYRKVVSDQKTDTQMVNYTPEEIRHCVDMVKSVALYETMEVAGLKVTAYYAGHVLGACMFHVSYQGLSVVYTGDYNTNSDRHLGAATIPRLRPNVVLTETTYATTIRDSKRDRERDMLKYISQTLEKGGKVLIPVFALGRAQQLCVLLETYWNRTQNTTPIYFSAGLIQKANFYYKLFFDWQNEHIQNTFLDSSLFDFKKIKPFDKNLIRANSPMVLLATPGMLHGGSSVQVFKEWCGNENNTVIIPGYCVAGTLGNKLLSGVKQITIDKKNYDVKMRVTNISFSAHADAKGILNLLRHLEPENIVFVHGDKAKMKVFSEVVSEQLKRDVFMPANFDCCKIKVKVPPVEVQAQVNEGIGYVLRFNQVNRFVMEEDLLKQANAMIDQILQTNSAGNMICCGKVQTTLSLKLQDKLFEHYPTESELVESLKKFITSVLVKKGQTPDQIQTHRKSYNLSVGGKQLLISSDFETASELFGWISKLNENTE